MRAVKVGLKATMLGLIAVGASYLLERNEYNHTKRDAEAAVVNARVGDFYKAESKMEKVADYIQDKSRSISNPNHERSLLNWIGTNDLAVLSRSYAEASNLVARGKEETRKELQSYTTKR